MTTGMNLAEVRLLARKLTGAAEQLRGLVATIDGRVHSTTWQGPDADRFRHDWWPAHRSALLAAAESISGLGRSAGNNADEQERASGVGTAGQGGAVGPVSSLSREAAAFGGLLAGAASGTIPTLVRSLRSGNPLQRAQAIAAFVRNPSLTLSGHQGTEKDFWSAQRSGSGQFGVVPASYDAKARTYARLDATESLTVDKTGLAGTANAGALLGAEAQASGSVGNQYVGADGRVYAEAVAGAQGTANVHLDSSGGMTAGARGQVGAYVDVGAEAQAHAAGVEAGARGQVEAGAEAHLGVTGGVGLQEVKAHVEMGASLGYGAGVSFDVDVRPDQVAQSVTHAATSWERSLPWAH